MNDTAKLLAIVILASFATERVVAATSYALDAMKLSRGKIGRAKRLWQRQRRKLLLMFIAAGIAAVVVWRGDIRVLKLLKLNAPAALDYSLSWMIVLGGADKLRALLGGAGAPSAPPAVKVVIDGEGQKVAPLRQVS